MNDRRGFTLLEVLVSLAILSVTLLLAYQVLSGAIAAEDRSERWTIASCLGEVLVRESTAVWPETGDTEGKFAAPMDSYSWTRSIVPAAHPDAREVHVTVTWSSEGREEQVTLSGVAIK
ncbi:prepilin-type N-terminal cleavage/methylation domain-containing protein [Candidatus Deferrimicrobium sp.]|uniref:prepilin-type N-terminal cleavage/methylation domain-containing protein n=1 Tax=Candidatus Deferrimicrobium sp. TaxID=3060586 RepID=UPI002ED1E0B3